MTQDKISAAVTQQIALLDPFLLTQKPLLNNLAKHLVTTFHQGGRLFLIGSGPFGAIAGLIGQTFLHRQTLERPALPAISLTNDAGLATFLASDEQGSQFFSRQLRALATDQDTVLVLAGTSLSPIKISPYQRTAHAHANKHYQHTKLLNNLTIIQNNSKKLLLFAFLPLPHHTRPTISRITFLRCSPLQITSTVSLS